MAEHSPGELSVRDPGIDPTSTYAVEPALVRRLTAGQALSGPPVTTTAPYTGGPLAELPQSTVEDVATAYSRARASQPSWSHWSLRDRTNVLLRLHDLVLAHREELLDLVQLESGKARLDAFLELTDVALAARYTARTARRLLRDRRRASLAPGLMTVREVRHPKGVVGLVSPWNYPLTLAVSDTIAALVAGNAVVHKPDNQGALTALRARELAVQAGLPTDVWQVVLGDGPTIGGAVVDGADFVSFTGSTTTGRTVAARAGERLVGVSLELGGKNPAIVLADAHIERAAEALARSCFGSAGQLCVSIERVLVHESVYDAFRDRFVARARELRLGAHVGWGFDVGSLVTAAHRDKVLGHVQDAVDKGALVLVGGRPRPDVGPYVVEPTIIEGLRPGMLAHDEETFGPVVGLSTYTTEDEAIAFANSTSYGLMANVFAGSLSHGMSVARRLHCGGVTVNEAYSSVWSNHDVPLGGMGDSGIGRRHGAEGLLRFTEVQAIAGQRMRGITAPFPGQTGEAYAQMISRLLPALKASRHR